MAARLGLLVCVGLSHALQLPTLSLPNFFPSAPKITSTANGVEPDFPYLFDGRIWFRPALVQVPQDGPPAGVNCISLFGWTLGGVVALEYDESPVGPYCEYVTMGSLVTKRGAVGQWGSRLYVSTAPAEAVCQDVWDVPAELANIEFREAGPTLSVLSPPLPTASGRPDIYVQGWSNTRSASETAPRRGGLPVLWTPQIKALWAPIVPLGQDASEEALALHRLRLSAKGFRLQWCPQQATEGLGIPLPIGLSVDGIRIEIGVEQNEAL